MDWWKIAIKAVVLCYVIVVGMIAWIDSKVTMLDSDSRIGRFINRVVESLIFFLMTTVDVMLLLLFLCLLGAGAYFLYKFFLWW